VTYLPPDNYLFPSMKSRFLLLTLLLVILHFWTPAAAAQGDEPTPTPSPADQLQEEDIPQIHVVEEGETLFAIAQIYNTSVEALQQLNNLADPSVLLVGQELIIPGGQGDVVATIHIIEVGDTLPDLAAAYNTSVEAVAASNRLIVANGLVAGRPLTIVSRTGSSEPQPRTGLSYVVQPGDTLVSIAAIFNLAISEIARFNELDYPTYLFPGQRFRLPDSGRFQSLPAFWQRIYMYPSPMVQGEAAAVYVESQLSGLPEGQLADQELNFVPYENGYLALVGLDAFTKIGRYSLELSGLGDRPWPEFTQAIEVTSGEYGTQLITVPDELSPLLAPEVREEDEAVLATVFGAISPKQHWNGTFQVPVSNTLVTAGYGDARSYNGGPIEIFHTGIDFAGAIGTPVMAVAAGTVVYSDTLPLFGNTLIVDHGLGVMTAYYHLSAYQVSLGDQVEKGQVIAAGGSTGLSSGPHLHWDLRVANVPVNGLQWTREDLIGEVISRAGLSVPEAEDP
jgi:murein DD-endopeptidase MepM/ murein hydrolase activator NlpD